MSNNMHHSHRLVLCLGLTDLQANRNWSALIDDFIDLDFLPQDANRWVDTPCMHKFSLVTLPVCDCTGQHVATSDRPVCTHRVVGFVRRSMI